MIPRNLPIEFFYALGPACRFDDRGRLVAGAAGPGLPALSFLRLGPMAAKILGALRPRFFWHASPHTIVIPMVGEHAPGSIGQGADFLDVVEPPNTVLGCQLGPMLSVPISLGLIERAA